MMRIKWVWYVARIEVYKRVQSFGRYVERKTTLQNQALME